MGTRRTLRSHYKRSSPDASDDSISTRAPLCVTLGARTVGSPSWQSPGGLARGTQENGVALAAATTERGGTETTAAAAELVQERQSDAVAAHADRVPEGDGAT